MVDNLHQGLHLPYKKKPDGQQRSSKNVKDLEKTTAPIAFELRLGQKVDLMINMKVGLQVCQK